jgi:hypothetical protein
MAFSAPILPLEEYKNAPKLGLTSLASSQKGQQLTKDVQPEHKFPL